MNYALVLFFLSAFFVIYVILLYPLGASLMAGWKPRPVRNAPSVYPVSVLIPVRNGEPWIREKLQSVLSLNYPADKMEVLVISDGSDDQTEAIAREFAPRGVKVLRIPQGGKAAALNEGMRHAGGEILLFTDVRQPMDPDCLRILTAYFADPGVGAVSGFEQIRGETEMGLYARYERWIRRSQSLLDSILGATGCIYAMRKSLAEPLPPNTLCDDMYLPLTAFLRGHRIIHEDRAKVYDFPAPTRTEFRRKVRTLAGVYQMLRFRPALLGPSNRMWIHFVSHKLGRLLLPLALLAMAATGFWLPPPWAALMLAGQGMVYGLAAVDGIIPKTWIVKRLSSPARAFVMMMAAALTAATYWFRPTGQLWRETRIGTGDSPNFKGPGGARG